MLCPFDFECRVKFQEHKSIVQCHVKLKRGDVVEDTVREALFSRHTQGSGSYTVPLYLSESVLHAVVELLEAEVARRRDRALDKLATKWSLKDQMEHEESDGNQSGIMTLEEGTALLYRNLFFSSAATMLHLVKMEQQTNRAYRQRMQERDEQIELLRQRQSREMDALCDSDSMLITQEDESLLSMATADITNIVHEHMRQMEELETHWRQELDTLKKDLLHKFRKFLADLHHASETGDRSEEEEEDRTVTDLARQSIVTRVEALSLPEYEFDHSRAVLQRGLQQDMDTKRRQMEDLRRQMEGRSAGRSRHNSIVSNIVASAAKGALRRHHGSISRTQSSVSSDLSQGDPASRLNSTGASNTPIEKREERTAKSKGLRFSAKDIAPRSTALQHLLEEDADLVEFIRSVPHHAFQIIINKNRFKDEIDEYYLPIEEEERERFLRERAMQDRPDFSTRKINLFIISLPQERLAKERHLLSSLLCCYEREDIDIEIMQRKRSMANMLTNRLSALFVNASPVMSPREAATNDGSPRSNKERRLKGDAVVQDLKWHTEDFEQVIFEATENAAPELHFDDFNEQVQDAIGRINTEKNCCVKTGDVLFTRHSNLRRAHLIFHLLTANSRPRIPRSSSSSSLRKVRRNPRVREYQQAMTGMEKTFNLCERIGVENIYFQLPFCSIQSPKIRAVRRIKGLSLSVGETLLLELEDIMESLRKAVTVPLDKRGNDDRENNSIGCIKNVFVFESSTLNNVSNITTGPSGSSSVLFGQQCVLALQKVFGPDNVVWDEGHRR